MVNDPKLPAPGCNIKTILHDNFMVYMARCDIPSPIIHPPKAEGGGWVGTNQPCCEMSGAVHLQTERARDEEGNHYSRLDEVLVAEGTDKELPRRQEDTESIGVPPQTRYGIGICRPKMEARDTEDLQEETVHSEIDKSESCGWAAGDAWCENVAERRLGKGMEESERSSCD
jgi:hypothetical protein